MRLSTINFSFTLDIHAPVTSVINFANHYLHEHWHFSLISKSSIGKRLKIILQVTLLSSVILSLSFNVSTTEYLTLNEFVFASH